MTKSNFLKLFIAVIVVAGAYWLLSSQRADSTRKPQADLLAGIDGSKIARLRVEQGSQVVELAMKDGRWTLPARFDYPADAAKVRSLLLKLFSMSDAHKLPSSAESFDKLGLSEDAIERGRTKVSVYDASGAELGGIRLGDDRRGRTDSHPGVGRGGQYVRTLEGDDVYLLPLPISVSASLAYWYEPTIVSILQSAVLSVEQTLVSEDGEQRVFQLKKSAPDAARFQVDGEVPPGQKINEAVFGEIASALENLRLDDVFRADADEVKDLEFSSKSTFTLSNGLVYEVRSSEKTEKHFVKLAVRFDPNVSAIRDSLEASESAQVSEDQAALSEDEETGEGAGEDVTTEPTPSPTPKKPLPTLSNESEAKKLHERFEPWVYELPAYQGKKFMHSRGSLFENIKAE